MQESYELPEFTSKNEKIPHTKGDNAKPVNMIADTSPLLFGKYCQQTIKGGRKDSLC